MGLEYEKLLEEDNELLEQIIDEQIKEREHLEEKYLELMYKKEEDSYMVNKLKGQYSYQKDYIEALEKKLKEPEEYIKVNVESNFYKLLRQSDLERLLLEKLPGKYNKDTEIFKGKEGKISLFKFNKHKKEILKELSKIVNKPLKDIEEALMSIIREELRKIELTDHLLYLRERDSIKELDKKYKLRLFQVELYEREVTKLNIEIEELKNLINKYYPPEVLEDKNKEIEKLETNINSYEKSLKELRLVESERDEFKQKLIQREDELDGLVTSLEHFKLTESEYMELRKLRETKQKLETKEKNLSDRVLELESELAGEKNTKKKLLNELKDESKKLNKVEKAKKGMESDRLSWVLYGSFALLFTVFISVILIFNINLGNYLEKGQDFIIYAQSGFNGEMFEKKKMEKSITSHIKNLNSVNKLKKETSLSVSEAMEGSILSDIVLKVSTERDKTDKEVYSNIGILGSEGAFKWEYYKKGENLKALRSPYYNRFIRSENMENYWEDENKALLSLSKLLRGLDYKLDKTSVVVSGLQGLDLSSDTDVKYLLNMEGKNAQELYNKIIGELIKGEDLASFIKLNKQIVKSRGLSSDTEEINYEEVLEIFSGVEISKATLSLSVLDDKLVDVEYSFNVQTKIDNFTLYLAQSFSESDSISIDENNFLEDSVLLSNIEEEVVYEQKIIKDLEGKEVKPEDLKLQGD